jgi:hypothetical protein
MLSPPCREDLVLQMVQLIASYASAPLSVEELAALREKFSLAAFCSRRQAANDLQRAHAPAPEGKNAPLKSLELWLTSAERFIPASSKDVKVLRSDIYRAAGLGNIVGGQASPAAKVVAEYMKDHYQVRRLCVGGL